jgi:branched-chain amino acid transport system substrate-binding protein
MACSADKPVFGLVMSFSGWFAPIDADTIAGAKLAVAEINAAGGVLGQPIKVVEFDNKSEPPLGADGAVDVIGKGAKAILFPSDFDFGAPGAYVAQQKDVIAFSGASDPKFGVQGVGPLAYSTSNASQAQGGLMAEWAYKQKGWKTAYVLLDNTIAYTKSLCASFATRWTELAGKDGLLGQDTFLNNDPSITAQVTRITGLSKKTDLIFFCSYAPGGPSAIRQLRAAGVTAAIATGESLDGDYWIGSVPDLSNFYVVSYGSKYGDNPDANVNGFFKRFEAKYDKKALWATRLFRGASLGRGRQQSRLARGREGCCRARYFRQDAARHRTDHLHQQAPHPDHATDGDLARHQRQVLLRRPFHRGVVPAAAIGPLLDRTCSHAASGARCDRPVRRPRCGR